MIKTEIIELIERWKNEAYDEKYGATNYFMGKEQALKDVLEILNTSNNINQPCEE